MLVNLPVPTMLNNNPAKVLKCMKSHLVLTALQP